jgi:hypothetical protein
MPALKPLEFLPSFLERARTVREVSSNFGITVEKKQSVEVTCFQAPKHHARGFEYDHGSWLVRTPNERNRRPAARAKPRTRGVRVDR